MWNFPRFSGEDFPFRDLPNTPEQCLQGVRYCFWRKSRELLRSRKTLIAALESDEDFAAFWKSYRETHPDSENYLSSLTDDTQPFNSFKITNDYDRFLCQQKLSDISTSAREKIQSEFNAIRPTLYQGFLEKEAVRVNCDVSEVRPIVPVLPLQEDGAESELCSLPDDVFAKIMARLQTIEIFQMTQVCKSWRQIIYRNASVVTRAEHSLTTHLLTFTEWMDPSNVVKGMDFRVRYDKIGWSLIKWCCNISQNLETLVMPQFPCLYDEVMHLLRQCPNLKHLQFKFRHIDKKCKTDLNLPKLESLIAEESNFGFKTKTVMDVFKNSRSFRVFKGKLTIGDITLVKAKSHKQNAFSNLTALELLTASPALLTRLDALDQLPLRYLCIGDALKMIRRRAHPYETTKTDKAKKAFHRLLPKLDQLEVLVSLWDVDLDVNTVKIMTKKQQNLKRALLRFRVASLDNEGGSYSKDGRDNYDDQVALISFEEMLLEKDPSRDLSQFEFIVNNARSKSLLRDAMTGFLIYRASEKEREALDEWSLSDPAMRRLIGIEF